MKCSDNSDNIKTLSDDELITAYLQGDDNAFEGLYERYKRQLYSYLNRLLGGQHALIDDVFQQTWVKIIDKLPTYCSQQRFVAWAFRIAHNLVMDYYRKAGRQGIVVGDESLQNVEAENQPWSSMDRRELKEVIDRAMESLSPELREVFLLRQEQISFKEIADIQECSINTALGRMQYAMKRLQQQIQKTEYVR